MMRQPLHLQHLLGKKVFDARGRCAGRIEEVVARRRGHEYCAEEFHLGREALWERLSIANVSLSVLRLLGARRHPASHKATWKQMDFTDPSRPRLRCALEELAEI